MKVVDSRPRGSCKLLRRCLTALCILGDKLFCRLFQDHIPYVAAQDPYLYTLSTSYEASYLLAVRHARIG